jgi:hypothetical protein
MKTKPEWIEAAARRSRDHAWALGGLLDTYCRLEDTGTEALAEHLGCTLDTLNRLSLCRRPEGDDLPAYVTRLSERFRFDQVRFVAVLRHALVVSSMRGDVSVTAENVTLMAARDRRRISDEDL